jgi:hypothetical protein
MYIGKVILKLCRDGYFVDLKIVLQQSQHYPSDIFDARPRASIGCVFRKFADARNDCTCAKAFGLYVSKNLVHFLQFGRARAQLAEAVLALSAIAPKGVLSSWAIAAVTASTLKARLARSRRCKMIALASRE